MDRVQAVLEPQKKWPNARKTLGHVVCAGSTDRTTQRKLLDHRWSVADCSPSLTRMRTSTIVPAA